MSSLLANIEGIMRTIQIGTKLFENEKTTEIYEAYGQVSGLQEETAEKYYEKIGKSFDITANCSAE